MFLKKIGFSGVPIDVIFKIDLAKLENFLYKFGIFEIKINKIKKVYILSEIVSAQLKLRNVILHEMDFSS